ncbi:hypothetical protein IEQ34_002700 [Dendrobium chrysotoxum]|uniref:PWWP domain-containing protein n=1 Tax=Dendrobium chrysotoxum TaxID=161865 RepID=A0AAV7HFL1_DENCH|nr:hypothetical protein IEQ34_002700 [Dendrobium chrysotoxum]
MENLVPSETLTPDPLPTESSDLGAETLAQTEYNAVVDTPFVAGEFVWAKVKGPLWWPALVSPEMKKESVLVSYFGDYDTLAWCEPKQLKPFLKVFDEMSRQSNSSSFARALESCMKEIARSLGLEMTCHCVPIDARPKPVLEDGSKKVPIANLSVMEFMDWIMDAARDVFVVNVLETLQLKSWVFAFGKILMQGDSWEFHRRRAMEDLVDKIDLDALPVEMVGGKEEEEEGLVIGVSKRRRRSMPKPIAEMDLDVLEVDDDEGEGEVVVEQRILRSKKRKSKEKFEVLKAEEEVGSSTGRRERKKSKYLSPPYTNLREMGKFLATLPKNLEEKTPRKAGYFTDHSGEEDDDKSFLPKIERMQTSEFFSEFVAAAENPLHLKGNRAAKFIKYFFAVYRKSNYSGGDDLEGYKKPVHESIAKTEDAVDNSGKCERNERNSKYGAYKETDLDFKQRKSNSKRGADQKTKLDPEELKRSRKNGTDRCNDLDSIQKKNDREKQRPRRKKTSKDGAGQGATINLDLHMEDGLDEGDTEQKTGNNKNGTNQGAPVDSDHFLANSLDEGKVKEKPRRKKKKLNDGTSKTAPADSDLHMVDASGECKQRRGRKRCKNDANGETPVNVDLQIVSSFHDGGSKKKEKVCKNVAINSQKPVLMNEKKRGSKEDANGKSFQNMGVGDTKCPEGGKSGPKKKGGAGPHKVKPGRRKAKRVDPIYGRQAALQLTFHSGIAIPSIEDLITSYSKYGALIDTGIELFEESNSARVVFANVADAENAFKDKAGPYGSVATYRLHYLSENLVNSSQTNHDLVSTSLQISDVISPSQPSPDQKSAAVKPALPYIRKSLETMISTLAWSSSPVNITGSSSDGLKPEARDNLVGEMQGLLQKVDKMLNGPGSSSST